MQGLLSVMNIAISLVEKSLAEPIPQNIDNCLFGFRYIIDFSGKDDKVTLQTAEILDSEWVLIEEASDLLKKEILKMVEGRNVEYWQAIEQETEIRKDRQY
ncbi:hypothetical protein CLV62_104177 [Dysgonomonas alginatilytica]|uniref:Uncharacterized protein n=1 Tax=Dysgonomonas alginatilytica TaxID=1605892 RepID=A0A2V3PRT7_9BACT|nr:hypothetical protein [Dysgonomonas alginatilytica]PXV66916.1 hypothetical protein CLV62_104177 [Dysgonomonas alginatilytica]